LLGAGINAADGLQHIRILSRPQYGYGLTDWINCDNEAESVGDRRWNLPDSPVPSAAECIVGPTGTMLLVAYDGRRTTPSVTEMREPVSLMVGKMYVSQNAERPGRLRVEKSVPRSLRNAAARLFDAYEGVTVAESEGEFPAFEHIGGYVPYARGQRTGDTTDADAATEEWDTPPRRFDAASATVRGVVGADMRAPKGSTTRAASVAPTGPTGRARDGPRFTGSGTASATPPLGRVSTPTPPSVTTRTAGSGSIGGRTTGLTPMPPRVEPPTPPATGAAETRRLSSTISGGVEAVKRASAAAVKVVKGARSTVLGSGSSDEVSSSEMDRMMREGERPLARGRGSSFEEHMPEDALREAAARLKDPHLLRNEALHMAHGAINAGFVPNVPGALGAATSIIENTLLSGGTPSEAMFAELSANLHGEGDDEQNNAD
jgi:hypothetical protein